MGCMAVPFLIIDGYNLMHAAGMARLQYGPGDLERCRNEFLNFLLLALGDQQCGRATVVFDAFDAPDSMPRRYELHGLTILFATAGGDADAAIEDLIAAHSAPRRVLVVSSDHRIQRAARKRRAKFSDSDKFLLELEKYQQRFSKQETRNIPQKYGQQISALETEYWLEEFGEIPTAEEVNKEQAIEPEQSDITEQPLEEPNVEQPPATEKEEWLDIFGDVTIDTDNAEDVKFWQQQIDDVIDEEG